MATQTLNVDPPAEIFDAQPNVPLIHQVVVGQLAAARQLLADRGDPADQIEDGPTGLPDDFERLRWFHLPPSCLAG